LSEFAYSQKGRRVKFNDDTWEKTRLTILLIWSMAPSPIVQDKIKKDVGTDVFFNIGPNIEYWLNGKGEIKNRCCYFSL